MGIFDSLAGMFSLGGKPPGFYQGNQNVANQLNQGMLQSAGYNPAAAGEAARNAAYGFSESRLNPEWAARGKQFDAGLANQGLDPGTEAYGNASRQFGNQMNDAYAQARAQAFGLGNQTQQVGIQQAMLPYQQYASLTGADAQRTAADQAQWSAEQGQLEGGLSGLFDLGGRAFGALGGVPGITSLFGLGGKPSNPGPGGTYGVG